MNLTPNERGEAVLAVDGQRYSLVLDILGMALAEDYVESVTGRYVPFDEILKGAERGRLRYGIALFYGSLRKHHKDVTAESAAGIYEKAIAAEQSAALQALAAAASDVAPDPEDVKALELKPSKRPQKARIAKDGTGASLS